MNIFTGFIPQFTLYPPVQKHSGPEKISRKHIYTEDKNFLAPLNPQFREHMYNQHHTTDQDTVKHLVG